MRTTATSTRSSNGRADGMAVERLLYAGNSLAEADDIFARAIKHRPRIRLTIRQAARAATVSRSRRLLNYLGGSFM